MPILEKCDAMWKVSDVKMNLNKFDLAYNKNVKYILAADLLHFNLMRLARVIMQADSTIATRFRERRWVLEYIQSYRLCSP